VRRRFNHVYITALFQFNSTDMMKKKSKQRKTLFIKHGTRGFHVTYETV